MKKALGIILILCFSYNLSSQENSIESDVLIFYVDASSLKNKLKEIQNEVDSIIKLKEDNRILLYLSNGETPYITTERSEVRKTLRKLRTGYINQPDYNKDARTINKLILENKFLKNLNEITQYDGINHYMRFYFIANKEDFKYMKIQEKLIDAILFSNKLKFEGGNHSSYIPKIILK